MLAVVTAERQALLRLSALDGEMIAIALILIKSSASGFSQLRLSLQPMRPLGGALGLHCAWVQ